MDSSHRHSLSAKLLVTATPDSHYCACLGHLGQHDTDRIISISAMPPKVAKSSTGVTVVCHCHWHYCANLPQCKYCPRLPYVMNAKAFRLDLCSIVGQCQNTLAYYPQCRTLNNILQHRFRERGETASQSVSFTDLLIVNYAKPS